MGFEQRIQARRYKALLETMKAAIAAGDALGARAALDEARELRPTSAELDSYEFRVAAIPLAAAHGATLNGGRWRAVSAVALLLAGIGFVSGIDYLQSQPPEPEPAPLRFSSDLPAATLSVPEPIAALTPAPAVAERATDDLPRGTAGRIDFERAEKTAVAASLRPAELVAEPPLPAGEVADDFVFAIPALVAPAAPPSRVPAEPSRVPADVSRVPADVMPPRSSGLILAPSSPAVASPPGAPASAAASAASAAVATRVEEGRVNDVLNAYARAYDRLDAAAARAVWPTVNERALARAFASLESQNVSFDDCEIQLQGASASASCRGQASYVGKVGSREPRIEARRWRFELRQDPDGWKIQNAEARRQ